MVPEKFSNYFLAGAGASAALIGLLFVAVSIAPERIFGRGALTEWRALAGSAFLALLDGLIVSLVGLIPDTNIGYAALGLGAGALINTLSLGRRLWGERRRGHRWQGLTLLVGGLILYGWEIWFGAQLIRHPQQTGNVTGLAYLLVFTYLLGVARAWELLGARDEGTLGLLGIGHGRRDTALGPPTDDLASAEERADRP